MPRIPPVHRARRLLPLAIAIATVAMPSVGLGAAACDEGLAMVPRNGGLSAINMSTGTTGAVVSGVQALGMSR